MRILGIDPGLKATGYGVIETDTRDPYAIKLLEAGTVEPNPRDPLQSKVLKIYRNIDEILLQFAPDVVVVEKLYSHYRHPTTACILGHARGVIYLACAQRRIKLMEHSVKRIRKAIVGNGNATKPQTRESVAHILKINAQSLTLDASDAIALAIGHAHMRRYSVKGAE
jgi:crossover junction endodeoxyribonuclease RuvC